MNVMNVFTAFIIWGVLVFIWLLTVLALRFASFKNWLVYAVSEAEKYLGAKTGRLKIRYAYDLAVKKFPTFAKILPWGIFSWLVDKALIVMRDMLTNKEIAEYIENEHSENH